MTKKTLTLFIFILCLGLFLGDVLRKKSLSAETWRPSRQKRPLALNASDRQERLEKEN